jgi:predicted XRE-type DNA-binding protein
LPIVNSIVFSYVANFAEAVYILHAFQKNTAQTPQRDIELAGRCFNALARKMKRRAELDAILERFIERRKLSQPEAAKQLGVSQPWVNDLLRGGLHRFFS